MPIKDFPDLKFFALFLFIFLVLIFGSIVAPALTPEWYSIDFFLAIFCIIAIIVSYLPETSIMARKMKSAVTQYYVYGTMDNPFTQGQSDGTKKLRITMFIGVLFSLAFIVPKLLQTPLLDLSIVLPGTLALTLSSGAGQILSSDFIVTFIQPILEETFRAGILDKTIAGWSATWLGIGIITIMVGALLMFFLFTTAFYVGLIILIVGIIFTIVTRNRPIRWSITPGFWNQQLGIWAAALIFGGLHAYAYSSVPNFQAAFIGIVAFGGILSEIDMIMHSISPSIVIHSAYNAIAFANTNFVYILVGTGMTTLLIFVIYYLYPLGTKTLRGYQQTTVTGV